MSEAIDWQALYFDPDTKLADRLTALARRRFGDSADAESAYNYALDAISANDWQRLRDGFGSRGSPAGFLRTAFVRLLEDYAIKKYGKKRPPAWLQRLGPVWKRIYEFLCLKRMPAETIVDHVCAKGEAQPATVRAAIVQIKARVPGCGQYIGEYTDDDAATPGLEQADEVAPVERLEQSEFATLLAVIGELLSGAAATGDSAAPANTESLRAALSITPQERLLLKLVYQQGASIAEASRALDVAEHTLRRRHKALGARLAETLHQHGIDADTLRSQVVR